MCRRVGRGVGDRARCVAKTRVVAAGVLGVAVAVAARGLPDAAVAQEPPALEAAPRVVVTGERRAADYLRQAGATAVLSAESLTRIDADHIQEALNRLPGVNIHRGSGQEHLTAIRSPVLTAGAGAGSFLFLQDGVPLRSAGFANVNGLFESASELAGGLEVVRGPGSTLYGSNAVHGLINVLTPAPARTGLNVEASLNTFQRTKAQVIGSARGDAQGFLLGVDILNDNSFREPAGVDQQKVLARWDIDGAGWSAVTTAAFTNLNQETAGFAQGDEIFRDSAASRVNDFPQAYRDAKTARLQSRVSFDVGEGGEFALTPFVRWTEMEFLQHFLPSQGVEDNGQWSVGALSTYYFTPSARVEATVGADVEFTRGYLQEFQPQTPEELELAPFLADDFLQGLHYDYAILAQTGALYGEAEVALSPRWLVEAGLRVEATRFDYDTEVTGDFGRFRRPDDRVDTFVTATPKLALLRRLDNGQTVFLRYARGARAPQTTDLYRVQTNQDPAAADPEVIDSVELGWRGEARALGRPFAFDAVAFAMDKRNFFFRDADGFNVVDGRTRHVGVETALDYALTDTLSAGGSATYARHTYRFDRPANSIVSGNDVDTAPRWLANARALWTPRPFELELAWVYVGEYFTNEANTQSYDGHNLLNLRFAWDVTPDLRSFVIVRNLANRDYAERADFAFGNQRFFPGEDRAITAGFRAQF